MNLNTYVTDAIRTESVIPSVQVNPLNLLVIMSAFVAAGNLLDMVKKNVFYGTAIDANKWNAQLETLGDNTNDLFENSASRLTLPATLDIDPRLFHAIIGIATESTELVEAIIKAVNHNLPIDTVNVLEELGDLSWYQAILVDATAANWEQVLITNIEKLKARYPDKFTVSDAINRNLAVERAILEDGAGEK